MSDFSDKLDRINAAIGGHDSFKCPHCGTEHSISEPDVSQSVVSYWGDGDPHNFTCFHCGKDFLVKEEVIRRFETQKTYEDFET
mgnify:CR=1 FL=1|jgi:predicted RNA-binding Zn-ribbon protein involved in translation (DUF1610 family)